MLPYLLLVVLCAVAHLDLKPEDTVLEERLYLTVTVEPRIQQVRRQH